MEENFKTLAEDMKNSTETALQFLDNMYADKKYCVNHDYHVYATNKLIAMLLEIDCLINGYDIETNKSED